MRSLVLEHAQQITQLVTNFDELWQYPLEYWVRRNACHWVVAKHARSATDCLRSISQYIVERSEVASAHFISRACLCTT